MENNSAFYDPLNATIEVPYIWYEDEIQDYARDVLNRTLSEDEMCSLSEEVHEDLDTLCGYYDISDTIRRLFANE